MASSISAPAKTLAPAPPASPATRPAQARTKKPSQLSPSTGKIEMCSHEEKDGDMKVAKKAWIAPAGQRVALSTVDHTIEFQVQSLSAEKMPFILHAVVVFTITPRTNDDDDDDDDDEEGLRYDDDMFHHFNELVKGVIVELVASMTLEEIFRGTTNSSTNHQAVVLFENMQLELNKRFRGLVVYVKPQLFVEEDLSYVMAEDGVGQTGKMIEQEVQSSVEDGCEQQAWVVQVEDDVDDEMKVQQKVQSSERPSKIDEIKEPSCTWAYQSLIFQVIYGNDTKADQLEQRKKSWPNYTLKALLFACAMLLSAFMNLSSSTSVAIKILFVVDILVFFIIDGVLYINLPSWGNALVCISCFLLQVALCLLTVPFNGCYAFAILVVVFLILVVALLQPKFQYSVKKYVLPSFTTDDGDTKDIGDQENHYLNHLFDISNGIATCGGLVTGILGYYSYMVGPVTAAGFFFFSTVLLGLYLMMVIAMRAVSPPHAACLTIVLKVLLLLTIITASISFVHHSVTNPQVVK